MGAITNIWVNTSWLPEPAGLATCEYCQEPVFSRIMYRLWFKADLYKARAQSTDVVVCQACAEVLKIKSE